MTVRVRTSGQLPWWFGIPFILGGLLFAGVGVTILLEELRYGSDGVAVTGTVTDLDYRPGSGDDGPTFTIRYGFTDPSGVERHGATDVGEQEFDAVTIGGPVQVTYLPAEPTKHRVGSPEPQLIVPVAFIGGGLLFAVIGGGLLVFVRAMRRNQLPSWVQVASESADDSADPSPAQVSAALAQIFGGTALASAVPGEPATAAAAPTATPAAPETPLTEAELRALDARFAPPAPSPQAPGVDERPPA